MVKRTNLLLMFFLLLAPLTKAAGQDLSTRKGEITSLIDGQAIRGIVPIEGNTQVEGFLSWEINYCFTTDTTGTWFLISESDDSIANDRLTEWDTTQISDGDYNLRLTLYLEGGRRAHTTVQNLRVRNYTPIETETPEPTLTATTSTEGLLPSELLTEIPTLPSPTPLPTNSLELPASSISNSVMRGAAGVLAAFVIIGLYSSIKKYL